MPPVDSKVNNVWANTAPEGTSELLTLPSGQTAQCKRMGMSGLVEAGILNDVDTLTSLVDQKHVRKVRGAKGRADGEAIDAASLMKDPESMKKIILLVDRSTPAIVAEPAVHLHLRDLPDGTTQFIPVEERIPGGIYTDQIGFEDKMFLFNWAVGGSPDVDRFLSESADAVEPVATKSGVSRPAKRATGTRKR
jgi:hypothetical protein